MAQVAAYSVVAIRLGFTYLISIMNLKFSVPLQEDLNLLDLLLLKHKIGRKKNSFGKGSYGVVCLAIDTHSGEKMAVVVDDEDRENEGDLIMEAQLETPEVMAFIVKHGTDIVCSDFGTFSMGAWSEDDEILGVVDDYDTLYFIKFNGEVVAEITKRNLKISSPIVGLFSNNNSYKHESYLHPFFLTSGPQDEYPSVHIRTLGDWSYQIYALFQEVKMTFFLKRTSIYFQDFAVSNLLLQSSAGSVGGPKLYIDGPYGSASPNHVKYDILVLIGLGIRATPFISSLRDVTNDVQMSQSDHVTFFCFFTIFFLDVSVIVSSLKFNCSACIL
ncbi:hypothetical protein RYX36_029725 [Vicia faba]